MTGTWSLELLKKPKTILCITDISLSEIFKNYITITYNDRLSNNLCFSCEFDPDILISHLVKRGIKDISYLDRCELGFIKKYLHYIKLKMI